MLDPEPLWAYMRERRAIEGRRARGMPWPWTDDTILRQYRFCCVSRRDDRGTRWLHDHWIRPNVTDPALWWAVAVARTFNYQPTLEALGYPAPHESKLAVLDRWEALLDQRHAAGERIYGSAYGIHPPPEPGAIKHRFSLRVALAGLLDTAPPVNTVEAFVTHLSGFPEWGRFMAYEVARDLVDTPWLADAPDRLTWTNLGPGARRGLRRLVVTDEPDAGWRLTTPLGLYYARELTATNPLGLDIHDVEHNLCEYDRYLRLAAPTHRTMVRRYPRPSSETPDESTPPQS